MPETALEHGIDKALQLFSERRLGAAMAALRELAQRHPHSAEPLRLIGVIALNAGALADADAALAAALQREPASPLVLSNLAALAGLRGDPRRAGELYRQALAADPRCVSAHNNLGGIAHSEGRLTEAVAHYRAALSVEPDHAAARGNLAACLLALDRGQDALLEARRATTEAPGYGPAWLALGQVLLALQGHQDAAQAFESAIALGVDRADAHYGLAQALDLNHRRPEALAACTAALTQQPDHAGAASLAQYLRRQLCRHEDLESGQTALLAALSEAREGISPFALLSEDVGPEWQRRAAELSAQRVLAQVASWPALAPASGSGGGPVARVGFVSSGFQQHPTALLIVALIEQMRGSRLHTIGYATRPDDGGPLRRRLSQGFATLRDLSGLSPSAMAAQIRADQVDVLFDLRGWGGGSAAEVFALRPAPIQVNWLAYPGTSGAPWIDYLLADHFVVPPEERDHYSEALIRLPRCFQPSDTTREVPEPPSRAELGLPEQGFLFACFNNSYKYSPESLRRWWAILTAAPEANLWLLDGPDPEVASNLRRLAAAAGVSPERLYLLPKQPHSRYLSCYRHAGLFLDTLPYNAHTTASDALWAGCPVLTLPGRSFAARVAGSLNHHLGLADLNARDEADYIARAVAFARDPMQRSAVCERLRDGRRNSTLFDMKNMAQAFENAVFSILDRARRGDPPGDLNLS